MSISAEQPPEGMTRAPWLEPRAMTGLYYQQLHWDFRLGSYLGLLRTMSMRDMVTRLYRGSALATQTFQRLKRTRELMATLVVHGLDSPLGREALMRIRRAHQGVVASNEEYKYVLAVFFMEPARFNAEFGVRSFSPQERQLLLCFWLEVGQRMEIDDLYATWDEWQSFYSEFEEAHRGECPQGQALAKASLFEVVRLVIPRGMQGLTRQALLATMQEEVRRVLGLPVARLPASLALGLIRSVSLLGAGRRVPTLGTGN